MGYLLLVYSIFAGGVVSAQSGTVAPPERPTVAKVVVATEGRNPDAGWSPKLFVDGLAALAWPCLVAYFLWSYRGEVRKVLSTLASKMDQAQSIELGVIKLVLQKSAESATSSQAGARPTKEQEQLSMFAQMLTPESSKPEVKAEMARLAEEYDSLRERFPSSPERTRMMNRIIAQMRALARACASYWSDFAYSRSAGDRLAAIAILQMSEDVQHLEWLGERFASEQPFVFYQAALALEQMARDGSPAVVEMAREALARIKGYTGGQPDTNTIEVLKGIVDTYV